MVQDVFKSNVYVGPWGGQSGGPWEYVFIGDLTRVDITYDDIAIRSIKFTTKDGKGQIHESDVFGGKGSKTAEIIMNPAHERLMIMEGKTARVNSEIVLKSFVFTTTKNRKIIVNDGVDNIHDFTYGKFSPPYNIDFPQTINGFFGRSNKMLNAIGAIEVFNSGARPAAGGKGGRVWSYTPKGSIYEISVKYDTKIHSISFTSNGTNGDPSETAKFGGSGGAETLKMTIDPLKERFIGVKGSFIQDGSSIVLSSVSFMTNFPRSFKHIGTKTDDTFSEVAGNEEDLTGFHGRDGALIDAIGLYVKPIGSGTISDKLSLVGPVGGSGNKKIFQIIGLLSRITITYSDVINSIQFESTDKSGKIYTSDTYGQSNGSKKIDLKLNIKDGEKLVGMSGTVDDYRGDSNKKVTSLSFVTEDGTEYGPFGQVSGQGFSFPLKNGFISGFHAEYESLLCSIGIFIKSDV